MEDSRFAHGKFVEFAAQGSQCSAQHVDYIKTFEKSKVYWLTSDLRKPTENSLVQSTFNKILNDSFAESFQHFFISFDIDSITGADCPGVSCPGSIGLTAQEAFDICRLAGACPQVRLIDLSEYNPLIEAYRTGRLVANMFYFFALGVAQRKA
jgi:formiminoglutamase